MLFRPMPLVQGEEPFHDAPWLFELKHDGFSAIAEVWVQVGALWSVPHRAAPNRAGHDAITLAPATALGWLPNP